MLVLLVRQRSRFVEHLFAHADLPDVVDVAAELDLSEELAAKPQAARDRDRVVAHTDRVASGVGVLDLEGIRQRLHTRKKELFESPRLRLDLFLEPLLVFSILEDEAPFLEHLRDAGAHLLEMERLGEIVHRALRETAHRDLHVRHRGDHHDGGVRMMGPNVPEELDAVHARHAEIADDQRDRLSLESVYRLLTVRRLETSEARASHQMREHLAQARLVIDDEAGGKRVRHRGVDGPIEVIRGSPVARRAGYLLGIPTRAPSRDMTRVFDDDLTAGFGTRAIHAGQRPEPLAGAIMTPLYLTSTYVQEGLGRNKGYEYARGKNPTREALERNVAALEGGRHGFAFASGMGCLDSIMKLFRAGDHLVCGENVYGGTYRLFDKLLQNFGLTFTYVDTRDPQRIEDACTPATRAVLVETPTNPLMRITDLAAVSEICRRRGLLSIVDNTFATPFFQRPFEFGADIVYHSTTKYLNGHSDMVGGIAVVRDDAIAEQLQFIHNAAGAVAGPFDAWLALRGTKTLHLRMPRHDETGRRLAAWLVRQVGEERVLYPGLPSHPQHDLASRQMRGFGGMISVELGSRERASVVLGRVRVFSLAESLGGVESLISHPASMTHASVPPDRRAELGISEGLIRLSCGVEDADDLEADLEQAFAGLD